VICAIVFGNPYGQFKASGSLDCSMVSIPSQSTLRCLMIYFSSLLFCLIDGGKSILSTLVFQNFFAVVSYPKCTCNDLEEYQIVMNGDIPYLPHS
jgi:hypothetical protein